MSVIVKSEPCSTVTSNFTVTTDSNSVKQFSTADVSCNVNSDVNKLRTLVNPSIEPILNYSILPEILITEFNSKTFQNYQNR